MWEGEFILLSVSCACKAWIKYLFFPTNIIHGFVVYANPETLSITSLPAFVFFLYVSILERNYERPHRKLYTGITVKLNYVCH